MVKPKDVPMELKLNAFNKRFETERTAICKLLTTLDKGFGKNFGACMSFNEGGSDYFNPIKAGMEIANLRTTFQTLSNVLQQLLQLYRYFAYSDLIIDCQEKLAANEAFKKRDY